ncbi:MAG: ABC transporter ATP-binding protein [Candidatus Dormibacteraeota bacterium]|nr:ABC transporter ATP-binding protein [Candidatus Dormibacteraeota bacterium]
MADALVDIAGLSVTYGGVQALHEVTLEVPAAGAVSLLGPNGAGKTSLLRAVSGLLTFHGGRIGAGRISVDGRDVTGADPVKLARSGIVQVLEGRRVFADLSVDDNLRSGAFWQRGGGRHGETRDFVLDLFPDLARCLTQPAGLLSGGQQQMLAIARALMSRPRLLLLDEPSLGLAPLLIRSIGGALRRINETGVGLLLVEQSSALAEAVTSRGYLLETGHVRASGETRELLADPQVRAVYLGVKTA